MAETGISCLLCQKLLKDPVTTPCGHNFCLVCINRFWDQDDQKVYSCPECRKTFTPRPVLGRNNMLAEVVEKLKKPELQAASPAHCYAGPGDVECDSCTGRKRKASHSCLVCLASYCVDHLEPHYQSPAFKKHKLVEASTELQENICSEHNKLSDIYCHTDQSFICYLCMMDEHKGHETVTAEAERTEKQNKLKNKQVQFQQRKQKKYEKVQELKQTMDSIKRRSQAAVDDSEKIFNKLISSIKKKRSEVTARIRAQEKAELTRAERLLKHLEKEITDLQRRVTELEQLSHTDDHVHFLKSFPSLCVSPGCEDSPSFTVNQHLTPDGVRKSLSDLKKQVEEISAAVQMILPSEPKSRKDLLQASALRMSSPLEPKSKKFDFLFQPVVVPMNSAFVPNFRKDFLQPPALRMISPLEPKSRKDFLQYFHYLTLDPNTTHHQLTLSEKNRAVTRTKAEQQYSDHSERFDFYKQVLCKESVSGRCYWEVERNGMGVDISVSYKEISRKGNGNECMFGCNSQSWSLQCYPTCLSFWHNNNKTELQGPASTKIGVYVDHTAGTLSFYNVSDTMTLLHRVHTTFTKPLYAGFKICFLNVTMTLCDSE